MDKMTDDDCRKLWKYIRFFAKRTAVEPQRTLSLAFDPAWLNYVEKVQAVLSRFPVTVKMLMAAGGDATLLPEGVKTSLRFIYNEITELDKFADDSIFESNDDKEAL